MVFLCSSVVPPKAIDEYRRDRELTLKSLLVVCINPCHGVAMYVLCHKVPVIKPFQVHSEVLKNQCDISLKSEYSPSNLAILLHQVYLERYFDTESYNLYSLLVFLRSSVRVCAAKAHAISEMD